MYYTLNEDYAFRGWKKLPYALRAVKGDRMRNPPLFFGKDDFITLLSCNGEENVDIDALSDQQRQLLSVLESRGVLQSSERPIAPLKSYQRYQIYPSVYWKTIHWSITGKCNYNCRHCLLSAPTNCHPQLSLSDCLRIVDKIAECGVNCVSITGGEPLVRADFIKLVGALSGHGIRISTIFTNGSLINESVLDGLKANGQFPCFQLSYDGVGHHDWLRNIVGAEEDLKRTIELLYRRGIPYICTMCIHKENASSLADTASYLGARGCLALRVSTPQELGIWKEYSQQYALSMKEAWEIYRTYIPIYFRNKMPIGLELEGFFSCEAGSVKYNVDYVHLNTEKTDFFKIPFCKAVKESAYIDAEGRLLPCMGFADSPLAEQFPNIVDGDLKKASWDSLYAKVADTTMQQLVDANPQCRDCEHIRQCRGGCMAAGTTSDGSWLHFDPQMCWFFKNVGEQAVRDIADAAIAQYV